MSIQSRSLLLAALDMSRHKALSFAESHSTWNVQYVDMSRDSIRLTQTYWRRVDKVTSCERQAYQACVLYLRLLRYCIHFEEDEIINTVS